MFERLRTLYRQWRLRQLSFLSVDPVNRTALYRTEEGTVLIVDYSYKIPRVAISTAHEWYITVMAVATVAAHLGVPLSVVGYVVKNSEETIDKEILH